MPPKQKPAIYDHSVGKNNIVLREITHWDNYALAAVIRGTMDEFKINKPNTVYFEPSTDSLFELFKSVAGAHYFVAVLNGEIAGGAGIFPTAQLPPGVCELVKMYLKSSARGRGIGKELIAKCLQKAKELQYKQIYLESRNELIRAVGLYEKFGFQLLKAPMGNSGHTHTDIWMIKSI